MFLEKKNMRILQYIKYEILDYFSADLYNNKTSSKAQKLQNEGQRMIVVVMQNKQKTLKSRDKSN